MKYTDDLLDPYYIRDFLSLESKLLVPVIQVFERTESTNNILIEKNCVYPNGHACFAEKQTNGRGTQGKKWIGLENNICFSVSWNFDQPIQHPHMLNYALAVKLVKYLNQEGFKDIKTKWPNDLICEGAKLGGILIDLIYKKNSKIYLVAGVGINFEASEDDQEKVDQKIIDLKSLHKKSYKIKRNKIASILLEAVIKSLSEFDKCNYKKLSEDWNNIDYNYDKKKTVLINNKEVITKLMGINEIGQLICFHDNKEHLYNINEVKLIKNESLRN
jgi:BirA family biotin operon repressor/biotin-[acetyl-CoA-carboxylase] ligase|tara:strand:- start:8040 stop:8861 length:822 start_codon:yes stop_codon:yes gene_type:complete